MITHLEPDILECKVKWVLGSITMNKANGGDGMPTKLFQTLKDDAVKVLHSICQQIWKTQQQPQDCKRSVFKMPKNVQTTAQLHSSHTLAKQCSKFFKPSFTSTRSIKFQLFKLDLGKAEEPEIKLPTSAGSLKNQEFQTDFIFWGSKITADCDCSHEIKRCLLLGKKAMTNLDSI